MAEPFLGEIRLFPFNQVPHGWSTCQGQTLSVQQYAALYALLGITYGGNGTTTFLLPDLRGRAALHFGTTAKLGAPAGTENVTLLIENLPPHTHLLGADMAAATQSPSRPEASNKARSKLDATWMSMDGLNVACDAPEA